MPLLGERERRADPLLGREAGALVLLVDSLARGMRPDLSEV